MAKLVSIGVIAEEYGVTTQTIRNWCDEGIFEVKRTKGGHRRFVWENDEEERKTILYSRVSSTGQKEDLKRQTEVLKDHCIEQGVINYELVEDIGSGINYKKRGLQKLVKEIVLGKVSRIIISFKDRLLRFGIELLELLCDLKNVELVMIKENEEKDFQTQLVEDVLAILTVYSAKVYGHRSHQKKSCQT